MREETDVDVSNVLIAANIGIDVAKIYVDKVIRGNDEVVDDENLGRVVNVVVDSSTVKVVKRRFETVRLRTEVPIGLAYGVLELTKRGLDEDCKVVRDEVISETGVGNFMVKENVNDYGNVIPVVISNVRIMGEKSGDCVGEMKGQSHPVSKVGRGACNSGRVRGVICSDSRKGL